MRVKLLVRVCCAVLLAVPLGLLLGVCASAAPAAEHVIHICVDGLNAEYLQKLIDAGDAPNFKRVRDEGAWTFNARTDFSHTNTLPNHTCMFTGRPTLQPDGMPEASYHGWKTNRVPKVGGCLHDPKDSHIGYVASVFDVVHDAGLSTALYASKDKFALYDQSYDANNGAANEHGRDKIDVYHYASDDPPQFAAPLQKRFLADMAERRFNYVFLHYRDTDSTGHALGWGSSGWMYALRNVDGYLGEVLKLVESDPKLAGSTAIIVATDHGGNGFEHDTSPIRENYTIPLIVWGAGVGRGDLYEMNRANRTEPGESRPEYREASQPIRNGELGNLALSLLGLGPIPGSMMNAQQDLRVSMPNESAAAE